MVLRNTMGINYNTLATLAGSKPWCLSFYHFVERAFVGLLIRISGPPHRVWQKKKKGRKKTRKEQRKAIFSLNDRQMVIKKINTVKSRRLISLPLFLSARSGVQCNIIQHRDVNVRLQNTAHWSECIKSIAITRDRSNSTVSFRGKGTLLLHLLSP